MVPQSPLVQSLNSTQKIIASLDVSWHRTTAKKQTLFPVWSEKGEAKKAKKGAPPSKVPYTLRATKGVNMHPFLQVKVNTENGSKWKQEEDVRISLVNASDFSIPRVGACPCRGRPVLSESKSNQLMKKNGEIYAKIKDGMIEFKKLQIGCCTGARGHGSPLCLKVEFVREGSPLKGKVLYSPQIDVGAKGPFAKIFCNNVNEALPATAAPTKKEVPSKKIPSTSYEGSEEMINLLKSLNLQKYVDLFLQHEVDLQAFLQLKDEDLVNIGITKVGPRVKILREISTLKECSSPPVPASPIDETLENDLCEWSFPLFDDSLFPIPESIEEPSAKRQKLISSCSLQDISYFSAPLWTETL